MTVFHPKKPEKEVISMRIPKDVLKFWIRNPRRLTSAETNLSISVFCLPLPTWKTKHKTHRQKSPDLTVWAIFLTSLKRGR